MSTRKRAQYIAMNARKVANTVMRRTAWARLHGHDAAEVIGWRPQRFYAMKHVAAGLCAWCTAKRRGTYLCAKHEGKAKR